MEMTAKKENTDQYAICWFDQEKDSTIIGIMVARKGRSDNEWTKEKVRIEKILQMGLDYQCDPLGRGNQKS